MKQQLKDSKAEVRQLKAQLAAPDNVVKVIRTGANREIHCGAEGTVSALDIIFTENGIFTDVSKMVCVLKCGCTTYINVYNFIRGLKKNKRQRLTLGDGDCIKIEGKNVYSAAIVRQIYEQLRKRSAACPSVIENYRQLVEWLVAQKVD